MIRLQNGKSAEGATRTQLAAAFNSIPDDLQNLLHNIITAGSSDVRLLPALQWVLVNGSLSLPVFYHGVRLATGEMNAPVWTPDEFGLAAMKRFVVHFSKGLLEIWDNGKDVHFIHESVKEHILSGGLGCLDPRMGFNPEAAAHTSLAEWCQDYVRLDPARYVEVPRHPVSGLVDTRLLDRLTHKAVRKELLHLPEYIHNHIFAHIRKAFDDNMLSLRTLKVLSAERMD